MAARGVLVTGGAGFIGGALLAAFSARGWRAIGCGRTRPPGGDREWRDYDLTWPSLPDALFDGVDVAIHAAYIKGEYAANVAGGRLLADRASRCDVRRLVYLSSLAAHERALSQYGRSKYDLQQDFADRGALVVRPGLVVGAGGLFAAMQAYLHAHRFVPLIDGGRQPLQTAYVDDLVDAVCAAVERGDTGVFTVAERVPVTYRAFYGELARVMNVRANFVAMPFWAADWVVRAAGALGVTLPIDRDNLLGLRAMQPDTGPWLDPPGRIAGDYRENLKRAAAVGSLRRGG